jgi:5-formyltetrahydrofolate cyclo-ligase
METKVSLRRHLQAMRRGISADVFETQNSKLVQLVIAKIEWSQIKILHCFLPLTHSNEPDMRHVIVYTTRPGKNVMELGSDLRQNLREYSLGDKVQCDVIIVPMLAYDPATKHRLGFGSGFYDRMLAGQNRAQKIGVCFSEFATELPVEPHDQALDDIIVA